MTSLEGWLLERMTVRRWIVTAGVAGLGLGAAGFGVGWKSGERHTVNEFAAQIREGVQAMQQSAQRALPEPSPADVAAVDRQQADTLARIKAQKAEEARLDREREALRRKMDAVK
ncbi:MAG: hypothetical protein JWL69_3115 [Phycisphaerales bacterium]|nr:hypothetical protein [Phycisphaerales bacterium]